MDSNRSVGLLSSLRFPLPFSLSILTAIIPLILYFAASPNLVVPAMRLYYLNVTSL